MLHSRAEGIDGVLVVSVYYAAGGDGTITHHRVGDVDGMVDAIEAHSDTTGANVYVGLQVSGLFKSKRSQDVAAATFSNGLNGYSARRFPLERKRASCRCIFQCQAYLDWPRVCIVSRSPQRASTTYAILATTEVDGNAGNAVLPIIANGSRTTSTCDIHFLNSSLTPVDPSAGNFVAYGRQ
jgi:hypothetical protein